MELRILLGNITAHQRYMAISICFKILIFVYFIKECQRFYDKAFANDFNQFLTRGQNGSLAFSINKDSLDSLCLECIRDHLKSRICTSFCSQLWLVH